MSVFEFLKSNRRLNFQGLISAFFNSCIYSPENDDRTNIGLPSHLRSVPVQQQPVPAAAENRRPQKLSYADFQPNSLQL
jgi:hypothetical protein